MKSPVDDVARGDAESNERRQRRRPDAGVVVLEGAGCCGDVAFVARQCRSAPPPRDLDWVGGV